MENGRKITETTLHAHAGNLQNGAPSVGGCISIPKINRKTALYTKAETPDGGTGGGGRRVWIFIVVPNVCRKICVHKNFSGRFRGWTKEAIEKFI